MLTFGQASDSSPSVAFFFTACIAIALYNPLETIILIFTTFKRFSGAYFWSLLIACVGLIVAEIGFSLYFYSIIPNRFVQTAVTVVGWCILMVSQSVVLWSRLHLVIQSTRILRGVLAMIAINAIVLLIPTAVIAMGSDIEPLPAAFQVGYGIMENIQVTLFAVQEFIISGLYIWGTINLLAFTAERRKRTLILQLFAINVVLVLMDCVVLGVQYAGYRILQINLKSLVFSIKLKLELAVLSRLVSFVQHPTSTFPDSLPTESKLPSRTVSEWRRFSETA